MKEIFQYTDNQVYELRNCNHLWRANIRTICFGGESIANLEAKIWNLIPEEFQSSSKASNTLETQNFPSRLCKGYANQVSFTDYQSRIQKFGSFAERGDG